MRYRTPIAAAAALMGTDYKGNRAIFPPQDVLAKCHYAKYNGEAMAHLYEDTITRVRAA